MTTLSTDMVWCEAMCVLFMSCCKLWTRRCTSWPGPRERQSVPLWPVVIVWTTVWLIFNSVPDLFKCHLHCTNTQVKKILAKYWLPSASQQKIRERLSSHTSKMSKWIKPKPRVSWIHDQLFISYLEICSWSDRVPGCSATWAMWRDYKAMDYIYWAHLWSLTWKLDTLHSHRHKGIVDDWQKLSYAISQ